MKPLCFQLGRFTWFRAFLISLLAIAILIILFYAEEDWRGARTWAGIKRTKAAR